MTKQKDKIKLSSLQKNKNNPRYITADKLEKLKASIESFEQMLEARPIVTDEDGVILGGNMRFEALKALGYKEIPAAWVKTLTGLTDEQKREFLIKDNVGFGAWDWDTLANEWESELLTDWGLDVPVIEVESDILKNIDTGEYTTKVETPIYEPTGEKPSIKELYNTEKTKALETQINNSDLPSELKKFLKYAAQRHTVFNYSKIAEFYAHSEQKIQELFEESALIIIDYNKAIENGFLELHSFLKEIQTF